MMRRTLFSLLTALLMGSLVSAPLAAATAPGHSENQAFSALFVDWEAALPSVWSGGDESEDSSYLTPVKAASLAFRSIASTLPAPAHLTLNAERPHARAPPRHL